MISASTMRLRLILGGAIAMLLTAGCATTAPQTKAFFEAPPKVPAAHEIKDVPFVEQSAGHCGPASLAMAMQWAGHDINVDELAPKVMTPGKRGSLQEDLVSASRREGVMAVRVSGVDSLVREVAAGHPVVVFENLGLSWFRQWHYAVVFGYDLGREEFIMHSGSNAAERTDMRVFERSWKLGDYWGLVVLPPGELSATAGELEHMQAAAGLEQAGHAQKAERAYKAVLVRWPTSLTALLGLGNLAYKRKAYVESAEFLRRALAAHPDSTAVQHNLRIAETAARAVK